MKIKYMSVARKSVLCAVIVLFAVSAVLAQNYSGTVNPETEEPAVTGPFIGEPVTKQPAVVSEPETTAEPMTTPAGGNTIPAEKFTPKKTISVDDIVPMPEDQDTEESRYTLGQTDVIKIEVLRHEEVSGEFVINNEGNIQYGFVGDIKVEGLTKDEVRDDLIKLLSDYIISPDVTVTITGYNSKIVYVVGEVGRPGKVFMRGDTITVRKALLEAGLPRLSAKLKKSKLFTPAASGRVKKKNINVHKLLYEGDLRENLVMNPGDTIYLPPTFWAKLLRVLQPVAAPVSSAETIAGVAAY